MATVPSNDGVTLSYRIHGSGPTTVMYLHGWAGSGEHFDEVIAELDLNALRVITMDFRGHDRRRAVLNVVKALAALDPAGFGLDDACAQLESSTYVMAEEVRPHFRR